MFDIVKMTSHTALNFFSISLLDIMPSIIFRRHVWHRKDSAITHRKWLHNIGIIGWEHNIIEKLWKWWRAQVHELFYARLGVKSKITDKLCTYNHLLNLSFKAFSFYNSNTFVNTNWFRLILTRNEGKSLL